MARIDLDAVRAESAGDPHGPYVLGGEEFFVPRLNNWPAGAIPLMDTGHWEDGFALVMGLEDYSRFARHSPTIGQFVAMFTDIAEREGLRDAGNSSRSSNSSRSTPKKSKPTSKGSTKSRSKTSTPVG